MQNFERCENDGGIDDRRWYAGLPLRFFNDNTKRQLRYSKFIRFERKMQCQITNLQSLLKVPGHVILPAARGG
jgi:hypothetical protein